MTWGARRQRSCPGLSLSGGGIQKSDINYSLISKIVIIMKSTGNERFRDLSI